MAEAKHLVLRNGQIYQSPRDGNDANSPSFASCMVVKDGTIQHVGTETDAAVLAAKDAGAEIRELGGKKVLPGFVDGHIHLLHLGQSLSKVALDGCRSLEEIRSRIRKAAQENPTATRIFARGWMHSMTPDGVNASMLDDLDPRPIFVDTKDLHFTWCNSAGLAEVCKTMGIDPEGSTPDPPGGLIQRDANGRPNGVFGESAVFEIIWPFVAQAASMKERKDAIRAAITAFNAAGYTGMIDMAMDDTIWEPLVELFNEEGLGGMRIAAYWLMKPLKKEEGIDAVLAQVDRAAALAKQFSGPDCRVIGIKVICDGIVDACTASLKEPYSTGVNPGPIWPEEVLDPVVARAHAVGLQVALHAIGDNTIRMAIDVLERKTNASRRPRIEHLELASATDAARLGKLGITASIQPVHADPAILRAWPRLLGEHRCSRAFPYSEFVSGGAVLALGSDAPTAPHLPLPNLYVATTRRSYREPECEEVVNPEFALTVCQAVAGATHGSAYSCFADEWTGSLRAGLKADFVVAEVELTPEMLIRGKVEETWFEGRQVFKTRE
jgi:predicted amidohydrolase YtcJ